MPFKLHVQIYEELEQYKEHLHIALYIVYRRYLNENIFFCDFKPEKISKRKTVRIKIEEKPNFYKELFNEIKEKTNKSDRAIVNNCLSVLVGTEQYSPKSK
ncbi:MAG: hypothetical protein ACNI3H_00665 [Halarcobacter ebronensis]|uniref:hypothetical protein n=1 Tax=Halarcobacter ebronensis TaxID=1462615 RepID=UPI003C76C517